MDSPDHIPSPLLPELAWPVLIHGNLHIAAMVSPELNKLAREEIISRAVHGALSDYSEPTTTHELSTIYPMFPGAIYRGQEGEYRWSFEECRALYFTMGVKVITPGLRYICLGTLILRDLYTLLTIIPPAYAQEYRKRLINKLSDCIPHIVLRKFCYYCIKGHPYYKNIYRVVDPIYDSILHDTSPSNLLVFIEFTIVLLDTEAAKNTEATKNNAH